MNPELKDEALAEVVEADREFWERYEAALAREDHQEHLRRYWPESEFGSNPAVGELVEHDG